MKREMIEYIPLQTVRLITAMRNREVLEIEFKDGAAIQYVVATSNPFEPDTERRPDGKASAELERLAQQIMETFEVRQRGSEGFDLCPKRDDAERILAGLNNKDRETVWMHASHIVAIKLGIIPF